MSVISINVNLIHYIIQYPISFFFQCKIDKMILFHAVAKAVQNFSGWNTFEEGTWKICALPDQKVQGE